MRSNMDSAYASRADLRRVEVAAVRSHPGARTCCGGHGADPLKLRAGRLRPDPTIVLLTCDDADSGGVSSVQVVAQDL